MAVAAVRRGRPAAVMAVLLALSACSSDPPAALRSTASPTPSASSSAESPRALASSAASASAKPSPSRSPSASTTPARSAAPTRTAAPTRSAAPRTAAPTRAPAAPLRYSVQPVTAADLPSSYRSGCPVGPSGLRLLTVPIRGFDGVPRSGRIVVSAGEADDVGRLFVKLFDARFPIRSMRVIDDFGGSDDRSMAADNTSAFNCRTVKGTSRYSQHSYGAAIDINPVENPYVKDGEVDPPAGSAYTNRSDVRPGMIVAGGVVDRAFAAIGWGWGGRFNSGKDYQHFSANGR